MNPSIDPVSSRYPSPLSGLDYACICDQSFLLGQASAVGLRRTCSKEAEQNLEFGLFWSDMAPFGLKTQKGPKVTQKWSKSGLGAHFLREEGAA